jgi:hypothetical protein
VIEQATYLIQAEIRSVMATVIDRILGTELNLGLPFPPSSLGLLLLLLAVHVAIHWAAPFLLLGLVGNKSRHLDAL